MHTHACTHVMYAYIYTDRNIQTQHTTHGTMDTSMGQIERGRTHSHKVGVFGVPHCHQSVNLFDQLLFLIIVKMHIPLGQTCFASAVLNEDETNLIGACEQYHACVSVHVCSSEYRWEKHAEQQRSIHAYNKVEQKQEQCEGHPIWGIYVHFGTVHNTTLHKVR